MINLLEKFVELNKKIEVCNQLLKNPQNLTPEQKPKIENDLQAAQKELEQLLKIKLADVITETGLGEISNNQSETILNRVRELNSNLDITQVKVQENSITDTAATIESIDQSVYSDGTVKVTFTLAKKSSNPRDAQKIITKDE